MPSTVNLPSSSRYRLASLIASGGMGSVYVGFRRGTARRPVAIKRAHEQLLDDPSVRSTLLAEARYASSIHHPNVVSVDDVEDVDGELLLVMDYIEGASVWDLLGSGALPAPIVCRIVLDACAALHAIHTASSPDGAALGLVHRDVSPHNILVGIDGVARVTDFGIAKAIGDASFGQRGVRRGKIGYMAPDYVTTGKATASTDVFALAVVMWEALTGHRLFKGKTEKKSLELVMTGAIDAPSKILASVGTALDQIVLHALARTPKLRYASARDFARAIEEAAPAIATPAEVSAVVLAAAHDAIATRRRELLATPDSLRPGALLPPACAEAAADELAAHALVLSLTAPKVKVTGVRRTPRVAPEPEPQPEPDAVVDLALPQSWWAALFASLLFSLRALYPF